MARKRREHHAGFRFHKLGRASVGVIARYCRVRGQRDDKKPPAVGTPGFCRCVCEGCDQRPASRVPKACSLIRISIDRAAVGAESCKHRARMTRKRRDHGPRVSVPQSRGEVVAGRQEKAAVAAEVTVNCASVTRKRADRRPGPAFPSLAVDSTAVTIRLPLGLNFPL
jgi:hypothetical protein